MRHTVSRAAAVCAALVGLCVALPAASLAQAPEVTVDVPITSPPGANCECLRGTVALTAQATASSGRTIASVRFERSPANRNTWTAIVNDTSPPYTASWNTSTLTAGLYDVRAVAVDSAGEEGASARARDRAVANGASSVTLDDPGTILRGQEVAMTAAAAPGGTVPETMRFEASPAGQERWTLIGEGQRDGLDFMRFNAVVDTTPLPDGPTDIRAVAGARIGTFVSRPRREKIVDNGAPSSVTLSTPPAPLSGVVDLRAEATDAGAGIASIRFERASAGTGTWTPAGADTSAPFTSAFDTRALADGRYDFRAIAVDRAGNSKTSEPVADVAIANPGKAEAANLTIEPSVVPARDVSLLGAIAGSPQHETWAYGFSNAAPALVRGERLPYTARGDDQLVLLRYTDAEGWQITDVLRMPDGVEPFEQDPRSKPTVTGQMTETGEAWLAFGQVTDAGSRTGIFHRAPGGRFVLDAASTETLAPLAGGIAVGTARLRLGRTPEGRGYGTLLGPSAYREVLSGDTPVYAAIDYGALVDGAWRLRAAELPRELPGVEPYEGVALRQLDPTGPDTGWGMIERTRQPGNDTPLPLLLARYSGDAWQFAATKLDVLDLTGPFDIPGMTVNPTSLRADGESVWVGAGVGAQGPGQPEVIARFDGRSGELTGSWCAAGLAEQSLGCGPDDVDHPARVPDQLFSTPSGTVALASDSNNLNVLTYGEWTQLPAPGFAQGDGKMLFTSPTEGWLAGRSSIGRVTATVPAPPLASWPQANRSTLTSVALPPGSAGTTDQSGALAVGLDGTAMRYDAAAGWQINPTPSRARRIVLRGVAFRGPDQAFAVGQLGTILRWDGAVWTEDPQSVAVTQSALNAVAFGADGQGWAVGTFGTILHFDGTSWSPEQPPESEDGQQITSVTVAGSDVFAVAGGNLISRAGDGTWQRMSDQQLPSPAPIEGDLRLVAGLPDGGAVAAGRSVVLVRQGAGGRWEYSAQPIEAIATAASAFREDGEVRAFLSVAEPAQRLSDVGGFPAGDGNLLRQTATGWLDLSHTFNAQGEAIKEDPVLAVASSGDGRHAWAVGGYAGTLSTSGVGSILALPARAFGWRTSAFWRYDLGGSVASPAVRPAQVAIPAKPGTVSFAFFSGSMCLSGCTSTLGAQPDMNLTDALRGIRAYATQPGGPAFALLGGNARGPIDQSAYQTGVGASDFLHLPDLLGELGTVPLYAAYGPRDAVPGLERPSQPWADAFAQAPAPFGRSGAPAGITPVDSGGEDGAVHRYYAFDAEQNGGRLRVIVLDNSAGSLEASVKGQVAWLDRMLDDAQGKSLPIVIVAARPMRINIGTDDAETTGFRLVERGVVGIFTTASTEGEFTSQTNRVVPVPENAIPEIRVPEFEGATLGYQQAANNGVTWYSVSVDTATKKVDVQGIPVVSSLALRPTAGLTVNRSSTLSFDAVGRRPPGSLANLNGNDNFPGFDNYVTIPAPLCATCETDTYRFLSPAYTFSSSDPTIGDFVVPSGAGSRFPRLNAAGNPTPSNASGLFCAYNSGTTTVSVTSGLLSSSLPVTVLPGDIGRPCGTVFRAGVGRVVLVPSRITNRTAQDPSNPSSPAEPAAEEEPEPAADLPALIPPPPPQPQTPAEERPPAREPKPPVDDPPSDEPDPPLEFLPKPTLQITQPAVVVVPVPPPITPIPPGGSASAQAAARRKEKAKQAAKQSAFVVRPAGIPGEDWFYPAIGVASLLTMLLLAGAVRPGPRQRVRPAPLLLTQNNRAQRWRT